jgi:4-hydroxy-tetrahydrodipicolinate synthase
MGDHSELSGVFAAALTPLKPDLSPDLDGLASLLHFLAQRGCHGALLMGTTGEGPSFSREERMAVLQAAAEARRSIPGFILMAGTGTPSLEDTIYLTKAAFALQYNSVVVLPPYYYRKPSEDALFAWFSQVLNQAVPAGGSLLGYHIPPITGIGFSIELISRLKEAFPDKFSGIKDSSGDREWAKSLGSCFKSDLLVLNGNDRLFSLALQAGASGCITAVANLLSPLHRLIWENYKAGSIDDITQDKLSAAREVLDRFTPFPPLLKVLLHHLHGFPLWKVKPPLSDFNPEQTEIMMSEFLASVE